MTYRRTPPTLRAALLWLAISSPVLAAPSAILTRVSGNVTVLRGGQKLSGKNGLSLQNGDKVTVTGGSATGGSATVFTLGAPPKTLKSGSLVVGSAAPQAGTSSVWKNVYSGLQKGLNNGNRTIAATMRPGDIIPFSPRSSTIESGRPTFIWNSSVPHGRYEVSVKQNGKEVFKAQTAGLSLPYPATAPTLVGGCSWQVSPLQKSGDSWVPDVPQSELITFKVAAIDVVKSVQRDLATIDAQLKTAAPADRAVARAGLWQAKGFSEAALRELRAAPGDPTASDLARSIAAQLGRAVSNQPAVTEIKAAPMGSADPNYLAFRPNSPFEITEKKTYVAPDGFFALQIPVSFCVTHLGIKDGLNYFDFATSHQGGTRLTLIYAPTKTLKAPGTLLAQIKTVWDQNATVPGNDTSALILGPAHNTQFRGHIARLTDWKAKLQGIEAVGHVMEWSEGDQTFVFQWSGESSDLRGSNAMRPLLDTLVMGENVPKPIEQPSVAKMVEESRSFSKQWNIDWDNEIALAGTYLAQPSTSEPEDLEGLLKAFADSPKGSYEASTAALKASRAAGKLGAIAGEKGDAPEAARLFALSADLDNQSNRIAVDAMWAKIQATDEDFNHWANVTPSQAADEIFNNILDNFRNLQAIRLIELHGRSITHSDIGDLTKFANKVFQSQRERMLRMLLTRQNPDSYFDQEATVANSFTALAEQAQSHSDLDAARAYFDRSVEWRTAIPIGTRERQLYNTLISRATLESELGDLRLARDFYEQAIADQDREEAFYLKDLASISDQSSRESLQIAWYAGRCNALTSLGSVYKSLGNYALAEATYQRSLKILEPLPDTGRLGVNSDIQRSLTYVRLSYLYVDTGEVAKASDYLDKATAISRELGDRPGLARALYFGANIDYERSQIPTALTKLHDARALFVQVRQLDFVFACDNLESQILQFNGDRAGATVLARRALEEARQIGSAKLISGAGRTLASSILSAATTPVLPPETIDEVTKLLQEIEIADARSGGAEAVIATLKVKATLAQKQGKWEEALASETAAIARNETVRATSASADSYADQQTNYEMYDIAVKLLLQLKRPEEAFDMISRARSKKLRDNLQLSAMKSNDPALQELLQRATALDEKLAKTKAQLTEANSQPEANRDTQRVENLKQLIASTQAEFFTVSAQIKSKNPRFDEVLSLTPVELKKAQKSIPEGALLLQYAPLGDGLYIFAVTKNSLQIFKPEASKDDLNKEIRAYRNAVDADIKELGKGGVVEDIDDSKSPLRQASEKLSKWLLDPVRKEIDASRVVAIVPSGELFYLPFHTLGEAGTDGKWHFLIEDKPVAYLAKGDVLSVGLNRDRADQGKGILALGDPTGAQLPAAKLEVESIAKIFPDSRALTGAGASKMVLLQPGSRDKQVLHLAAHGVLNSANPDQSYIQLSPTATDDGKLRVGEILGIDLNKVDLVTLSACQTALGEGNPDGTEISSLAQSFSTAGTPSVIASLWSVEDKSTQRLMETFYSALADGVPKGAALQKAQIELLKDPKTRNPVYWAPFELLGDWR